MEHMSDKRLSKDVFSGIKESMSSLSSEYPPEFGSDIAPMLTAQAVRDENDEDDEDETVRWLTNFELSLEGPLVEESVFSTTKYTIY